MRAAFLAACLLVPAAAGGASLESSAASSERDFRDSLNAIAASAHLLPSPGEMAHDAYTELLKKAMAEYFRTHTFFPKAQGMRRPNRPAAMTLALGEARNAQWRNPAKVSLAGVPTSLCGQFSRGGRAYFGVTPDDAEPAFFSADDLLEGTPRMPVGASTYRISLVVNLLDPIGSKMKFVSESDKKDSKTVTLRRMLEVAHASGELLVAGEPMYRVFFGQDLVDGPPATAGARESVVFVLQRGDDYFTYLAAKESIPADGSCALFPLHRDQPVCLGLKGDQLNVFLP